ncbi:MAG: NAD-binding protein [Nitriliruptorales bacterium]|nr:NAD-binding protein [Nitriliruptorales bacterium]
MNGRVGAVGLGLLGSALTGTLLERGFDVYGFDLDPQRRTEFEQRGGRAVDSVAAVAESADRLLLALPTSEISRTVCLGQDGIATAAQAGTVVMDATTARPSDSVAISRALAEHGVDYLDTAISGSSAMAWQRDIVVMAGGSSDALERVRPVLETAARSVRHVGGPGAGARTKLIVNLMLGAHRVVLAEALVLGEQAGVDLDVLLETLKDSAAYSKAMDGWGARMVTGDHDNPMSRIRQHAKDVRLILEEGQAAGSPLWMASTVAQVLAVAQAQGLGDADNSGVIAVFRALAAATQPQQEPPPA